MKIRTSPLKLLAAAAIVPLLASTTAQAAITLVDTLAVTSTDDLSSYTINASTLDITGASKLVVTVGTEGVGNTAPNAISSITYGGASLAVAAATPNTRSNVWYIDLAGETLVGTDIVLTFAGANTGYGLGAYTLSGTADGVSSTASTSTTTLTVNPPTAGEFLIASYSRNTSGTAAGGDLTELFDTGLDGQYQAASLYTQLTVSGSQDISVTGMNGTGATVAATFAAAIPEPAAALLGCFGLLALLRRRR